ERGRDLHQLAEAQIAGEVFGGREHERDRGRQHRAAVADPGHVRLLHDHPHPAPGKLAEGLLELDALVAVAADQSDVLGRVAHAGEFV
ncbi:MAG: hypothetical protein AVDCRST_MAG90-686, partial [uncultured Microvirga sp.]